MSDLGYKFTLLAEPGDDFCPGGDKNLRAAFRFAEKMRTYAMDNGCVFIQLQNPKGETNAYYYDDVSSARTKFKRAMAAYATVIGLTSVGSLFFPNSAMLKLSVPLAALLPLAACTTDRGTLRRRTEPLKPNNYLVSFSIDEETYKKMSNELRLLSREKHHGIYSKPFNNCARFAISYAKSNGFAVPQPFWATPNTFSDKIASEREIKNTVQMASRSPKPPITG